MKIRNGFVSNSSSSSFVWLGIRSDIKDYEELDKKVKEFGLQTNYVESKGHIVGKKLGSWSSDSGGCGITSLSLTELEKVMKDTQAKVNQFTGREDVFIELIFGEVYG
jgi:hypothetical protein